MITHLLFLLVILKLQSSLTPCTISAIQVWHGYTWK